MCDIKRIPVAKAIGLVLAHDITEIRKDEFKGRAFKKGYVVRPEDVGHLQNLGKMHLYALTLSDDEMHEDDTAYALARALMGEGVKMAGEPKEGKINLVSDRNGLLKVNKDALLRFNMLGEVACATLHNNTVVKKGQAVAGTRSIPLVMKRKVVEEAANIANSGKPVIAIKEFRKAKAGIVITGNEVYQGRIKDAFAPILMKKIESLAGEIVGICYAPDNEVFIADRLKELIEMGADLLLTTGGMSVDPDDVTRFAIRSLQAVDLTYGSAVLPGSMFLVGYIQKVRGLEFGVRSHQDALKSGLSFTDSGLIPILGIPACGMYHKVTVFDLILPRILVGERIGRKELAEIGHGGLCMDCEECKYPLCPFGR